MSQYTENVTSIIGIIDRTIHTYELNKARITDLEGMSNDLMHEISLGKKRGVVDGYRLYEQFREVLIERYEKRDENEELEALYNYFNFNRNIKNDLNRVLTETQKAEAKLNNRVYVPRVLNPEELTMKTNIKTDAKNKPFKDLLTDFKKKEK